jgi:flagellar motor switch protein FliN/FliY
MEKERVGEIPSVIMQGNKVVPDEIGKAGKGDDKSENLVNGEDPEESASEELDPDQVNTLEYARLSSNRTKRKTDQMPDIDGNEVEPIVGMQQNAHARVPEGTQKEKNDIGFLLDIPLGVSVELGRTRITINDMIQLRPGSVIELDKMVGEPLDLLINDKLVARGEVVIFDESFGIRITDIIKPEDRLKSLH